MYKLIAITSVTALLSACVGGNSTSNAPADGAPTKNYTYEELVEKAESLESKFNDSKYTEPEAIQTSGEATYSGSLVVSKNDFSPMAVDSVEKIAAAIDLTAKFDTNSSTVAGKLHNFRTQNDATIAGELSIESTTVAHGNPIRTGISGELQFGQDSDEVKGELNAHYIGAAAEGIWGEIYLDADEYGEWSGEFIAEK